MNVFNSPINILDDSEKNQSTLVSLGIQTQKNQNQPNKHSKYLGDTNLSFSKILEVIENKAVMQHQDFLKGYINLSLNIHKLNETLNTGIKDPLFEGIYNNASLLMSSQSATFIFNFSSVIYVFLSGISRKCNSNGNNYNEYKHILESLSQNELLWLVDFHIIILRNFSNLLIEIDISTIADFIVFLIDGIDKEHCDDQVKHNLSNKHEEVIKLIQIELKRVRIAKIIESLSVQDNFSGQGNVEIDKLNF